MAIIKMLELSTAHVTKQTAEQLDELCSNRNYDDVIVYGKGEYGWIVYGYPSADYDPPENTPADLQDVITLARERGCYWIMFDRDADKIEDLKTYEW